MIPFKFFHNPKHLTLTRNDLSQNKQNKSFDSIHITDFNVPVQKFYGSDYIEFIDGDKKIILKNRYGNDGIQIL